MTAALQGDAPLEVGNNSVADVGCDGILTTSVGSAVNAKPRPWSHNGVPVEVEADIICNNQNTGWVTTPARLQVLPRRDETFRELI